MMPVRNLHVAFHLPHMSSGGVEKMRINLAREMLNAGIKVDFVLCERRGDLLPQVPAGVRIFGLGARRTINSLLPLLRYMNTEKPDVVVSSLGHQNIIAILAARLSGVRPKIFVTQHNSLSDEAGLHGNIQHRILPLLYRIALPFADRVLAVSDGVADDLSSQAKFDREKITVIYNPVVDDALAVRAAERVDDPFFQTAEPVVLGVGRLTAQKGFDTLIRAVALANKTKKVRLALCGTGPLQAELSALANSLGVASQFKILGFQDNPYKYMAGSEIVVMSSRYEGFGNVLVEALASRTPVISTNCRYGPAEILDNGKYGQLVPVGNEAELAAAILRQLDAPSDTDLLYRRAQDFSSAAISKVYEGLIRGAL